MKVVSHSTGRRRLQEAATGLALGIVLIAATAAAAPVHPDDQHNRGHAVHARYGAGDRDWRAHEGNAHRYWNGSYWEPGVIYAPPVVYEPPYESPGINLIVPLNIR